jgi:hypothetical protein
VSTTIEMPAPVAAARLEELLRRDPDLGELAKLVDQQTTLDYPTIQLVRQRLTLLGQLKRLKVPVYRAGDIKAYKAKMIEQKRAEVKARNRPAALVCAALCLVFLAGFVACLKTYEAVHTEFWDDIPASPWEPYLGVGAIISVFLALATGATAITLAFNYVVRWRTVGLGIYDQPVPTRTLRLADRVLRAVPEAEFFVEELVVERIVEDPLLFVRLGDTAYYIDVWDEPGFTARPQA